MMKKISFILSLFIIFSAIMLMPPAEGDDSLSLHKFIYDFTEEKLLGDMTRNLQYQYGNFYDSTNVIVTSILADDYRQIPVCSALSSVEECSGAVFRYLKLDSDGNESTPAVGIPDLNMVVIWEISSRKLVVFHSDRCNIPDKELREIFEDSFINETVGMVYVETDPGYREVLAYGVLRSLMFDLDTIVRDHSQSFCSIELSSKNCRAFRENGNPGEKLDLVFIGEGIDYDELETFVEQGVYYKGLTRFLPSYVSSFNIWIVEETKQKICDVSSSSVIPADNDADCDSYTTEVLASECPEKDVVYVLSGKKFRSHAYPKVREVFISIPSASFDEKIYPIEFEDSLGRTFTHESGHAIFNFEDEYVEKEGDSFSGVNCQPPSLSGDPLGNAKMKWSFLEDQGASYYYGCAYSIANIKPHLHSIMENHVKYANWGVVNEYWIEKFFDNKEWKEW